MTGRQVAELQPGDQTRYLGTGPRMVTFSYDPVTLDVVEVSGDPEGFLGFTADAWRSRGFWTGRVHADDLEEVARFSRGCIKQGWDHELVHRVIDAAGRTLWIHKVVSNSSDEAGEPICHAVVLDITGQVGRPGRIGGLKGNDPGLRETLRSLTREVSEVSRSGDLLARHLSNLGDDVGSDHALTVREGLQKLRTLLASVSEQATDLPRSRGTHEVTSRLLMRSLSDGDRDGN